MRISLFVSGYDAHFRIGQRPKTLASDRGLSSGRSVRGEEVTFTLSGTCSIPNLNLDLEIELSRAEAERVVAELQGMLALPLEEKK